MSRPQKTETWLEVAKAISKQSTCLRRQVGCVLVDVRGHVLSTGYNGVASGMLHCNEAVIVYKAMLAVHEESPEALPVSTYPNACKGATAPSGTGLDLCEAIHAEANALLQCPDVYRIHTVYCTASPCMHCTKLLLGTSAEVIVFLEDYPAAGAKELWWRSRGTSLAESSDVDRGPTWWKWEPRAS